MANVGRPSEKTPETVKKLEEAFAMDCDVTEACSYANISRVTYYDWIKHDLELANRFEDLRQRPFLKARQSIVNGLSEPEFALKYMERKKKAEFALRTELTGKDGNPIEQKVQIDDAKFEAIITKYAEKRDKRTGEDSDTKQDI